MKLKFFISIFILFSIICNSQKDSLLIGSIEIKSYEIDKGQNEPIAKQNLIFDSINVKSERFDKKLRVTSEFEISGSHLLTEFYYDNDILILIRFSEQSREYKMENDAIKITRYYYENGELIDENYGIQISEPRMGIGIPTPDKWDEVYGYNQYFTSEFLQSYSKLLLSKITE